MIDGKKLISSQKVKKWRKVEKKVTFSTTFLANWIDRLAIGGKTASKSSLNPTFASA